MSRKSHWENVYESKPVHRLGWYKPHLYPSVDWIKDLLPDRDSRIIDVGGGASTFVDDLLQEGYRFITVVDLSGKALSHTRDRLGSRAEQVHWLEGDITQVELPENHFDLWHDRAVFHFLTDEEDRKKYIRQLEKSVSQDGYIVMGTFSPEAPPKCSGLPVERYDADKLASTLGEGFRLLDSLKDLHVTPGGVEQMYLYCRFKREKQ